MGARQLVVLTTGGTIAMREDAPGSGAVPRLHVADLLPDLPSGLPEVTGEVFCNLPSAHLTLEMLWGLRQRVAAILAHDEVAGIVIPHGTDTMEETAYLLDLTIASDKPVVLTGAMRTASDVGYEGLANMRAALLVAADPQAAGLGALVVLNDTIHAARYVTKMHTQSLDTFQSPGWGPLGRVEGDRVIIACRTMREVIPTARLETRVALLRLAVGMEADPLRETLARGVRGIVIEGLGGGRVPPWWMDDIRTAIAAGVPIVIASRCPSGAVGDRYGYVGACRELAAAGALLSDGLNGAKARLKLMVTLGATDSPAQVRALWP